MPWDFRKTSRWNADTPQALSAYILGRGGIVGEDAVMDAASLPKVEMPDAEGFVPDPRLGTL